MPQMTIEVRHRQARFCPWGVTLSVQILLGNTEESVDFTVTMPTTAAKRFSAERILPKSLTRHLRTMGPWVSRRALHMSRPCIRVVYLSCRERRSLHINLQNRNPPCVKTLHPSSRPCIFIISVRPGPPKLSDETVSDIQLLS